MMLQFSVKSRVVKRKVSDLPWFLASVTFANLKFVKVGILDMVYSESLLLKTKGSRK